MYGRSGADAASTLILPEGHCLNFTISGRPSRGRKSTSSDSYHCFSATSLAHVCQKVSYDAIYEPRGYLKVCMYVYVCSVLPLSHPPVVRLPARGHTTYSNSEAARRTQSCLREPRHDVSLISGLPMDDWFCSETIRRHFGRPSVRVISMCLTGRVPMSGALLRVLRVRRHEESGFCKHSRYVNVERSYTVPPMIASATT